MSATHSRGGRKGSAPPKPNGAAGAHARQKRPKRAEPKLAPFAAVEVPATGAQMWPVHPVAWFYPELNPRVPESSGLTIESCRKPAAPDFARLEVTPADQSNRSDEVCDPLLPEVKRCVVESDLAPSGWDPRVAVVSAGSVPKNGGVTAEAPAVLQLAGGERGKG